MFNSVKEKRERVGRMVQMHANAREEIKEVRAGDIAAAIGLKDVTTGDTLCSVDHKIVRLSVWNSQNRYLCCCRADALCGSREDGCCLGKLAQEDPSFRVQTMKKQAKLSSAGMGELTP